MRLAEMPDADEFSRGTSMRYSVKPSDDISMSVKPRGYVDNDTDADERSLFPQEHRAD